MTHTALAADDPDPPRATGGIVTGPLTIGHGGCLLRAPDGRPLAAFIPNTAAASAIAAELRTHGVGGPTARDRGVGWPP